MTKAQLVTKNTFSFVLVVYSMQYCYVILLTKALC